MARVCPMSFLIVPPLLTDYASTKYRSGLPQLKFASSLRLKASYVKPAVKADSRLI